MKVLQGQTNPSLRHLVLWRGLVCEAREFEFEPFAPQLRRTQCIGANRQLQRVLARKNINVAKFRGALARRFSQIAVEGRLPRDRKCGPDRDGRQFAHGLGRRERERAKVGANINRPFALRTESCGSNIP